jgi:SAM-dependent methyltransferase
MLSNYELTQDGVITQIKRKPKTYDTNYFEYYNRMFEQTINMSYLRLGHLIGSLDKIPDSILDVGYGTGAFLSIASKTVSQCYGFDVTDIRIPVGCKRVQDITTDKYDVVCFFDSLEHMEDIEIIKQVKANYICISTPWCHYLSDEWFKNWKHHKPNEHLWYFNDKALIKFMNRMGYDCISITAVEDIIRKIHPTLPNIITGIFKRRT